MQGGVTSLKVCRKFQLLLDVVYTISKQTWLELSNKCGIKRPAFTYTDL